MAALQRAVAGGDDDHVAVGVGQALGLHVPGPVEVALDEALAAAERGDRLADRRVVQLGDLLEGAGDLQAAAAAAEGGLDRDRQAVLLGEGDDLVGAGDRVGGAGDQRGAGALGDVPGGDLVAEVADGLRGRADPGQAGVQDRLGELGVLREEAVAGVDGVGAGLRRPRPAPWRCPGSWRPGCHRPGRTPRRPRGRAARPGPGRRRRPRSRSRRPGRPGRRGQRFRHGWR